VKHVLTVALVAAAVAVPSAAARPHVSSVVHVSAATTGLRYTRTHLTAKAGRIEVVFSNPSTLPHNVRLEQGETELGGTRVVTHATTKAFVTLKRGSYHFYCSVPGHEDAGMQGTLTVR
jgi:plastocyanin